MGPLGFAQMMGNASAMITNLGLLTAIAAFGCVLTAISLPYLRNTAIKYDVVAYPGGRKLHDKPTPLLGGVGIFLPLAILSAPFLWLIFTKRLVLRHPDEWQMFSLLAGSAWMLVLGTIDDKFGLGWKKKLSGQLLGILILIWGGHTVARATIPGLGVVDFAWTGPIVFAVAVVVITNAINLIDGLDGLAGGICFFAAITHGIIAIIKGDLFAAFVCFTISGSLLGFLRYNFPPASIYMGDGGSLMLGFLLGTLATSSSAAAPGQRSATLGMIIIPFLPFGIALLDVALAVARRWISGRKIFWADSDHLHHRLMEKFQHPRRVVFILYAFSALLSVMTIGLAALPEHPSMQVFIIIASLVLSGVVVYLLRLYRIENLPRILENRLHFKFLSHFHAFMSIRVERATSSQEILQLLEVGVKDLGFDDVEVFHLGRSIQKWSNPCKVHPESERCACERRFEPLDIVVRWTAPTHESISYQKCLEITWFRFLTHVESRIHRLSHVPLPNTEP